MKYGEAVNQAIDECMADPSVVICGQQPKHGPKHIITGLYQKYPDRCITFPVCENLMNSAAMGMSLAGLRPIVFHERFDFAIVGMDALANHIPLWSRKCGVNLPLVMVCVVGKGGGQGPQHSKDFSHWFKDFEGWTLYRPMNPIQAYENMKEAITGNSPSMFVAYRELFKLEGEKQIPMPNSVRFCGASPDHEREFYR